MSIHITFFLKKCEFIEGEKQEQSSYTVKGFFLPNLGVNMSHSVSCCVKVTSLLSLAFVMIRIVFLLGFQGC